MGIGVALKRNKNVLSFFLKINKDCAFLISTGKEFQRVGAAPEKERAPQAWV